MTTCCPRCRGVELVVSNLAELPITLCLACGDRVESNPLDAAPKGTRVAPATRVPPGDAGIDDRCVDRSDPVELSAMF